jgi:nicotinamidase-related amidase
MPFKVQIATRDYHPCDHVSFAKNNGVAPFSGTKTFAYTTPSGETKTFEQFMWPNHCVQGSKGSEIVPEVDHGKIDKVFFKACNPLYDSYSGFGDGLTQDGKIKEYEDTGLLMYLRSMGIQHVVVCGVATDYCVKATCVDAAAYGMHVTLVESACRGVDPQSTADALIELQRKGVDSNGVSKVTIAKTASELSIM